MTIKEIPQDSALRDWCNYLSITEVPVSYQIAAGLSCIGVMVRRQRWVDQVDWRVYPNQSIMFIGPSGIGKDTIINRTQSTIQNFTPISKVQVIGGTTIEGISARLADLGRPACAYIPAPEITSFFGKSDYQANMLTGITNLLSNGDRIDITTKGNLAFGGPKYILEPTLTMHAGSTVEWLHKGMPEGTLEGGFMGRFLIIIEDLGSKCVALVKRDRSKEDILRIKTYTDAWKECIEVLLARCRTPHEMIMDGDAEDMYTNWYHNRFKMFSRAVMPYANRSRDMVLRLAMLMALSRRHDRLIEGADMAFGISILREVAARIDSVVLPPSIEAQIAGKVLDLLPATGAEIYAALGMRYSVLKHIDPALDLLRKTGKVRMQNGHYTLMEGDN